MKQVNYSYINCICIMFYKEHLYLIFPALTTFNKWGHERSESLNYLWKNHIAD